MLADAEATGSSESILCTNDWISPPSEGPRLHYSIKSRRAKIYPQKKKKLDKGAAIAAVATSSQRK